MYQGLLIKFGTFSNTYANIGLTIQPIARGNIILRFCFHIPQRNSTFSKFEFKEQDET